MPAQLSIRKLRDISPQGPFGLLVESTAPLNVEEGYVSPISTALAAPESSSNTESLRAACAHLASKADQPADLSIVVQIHGFNNPAKVAYTRYGQAWDHYREFGGDRLLYVGYRWPGEAMGSTLSSSLRALPGATFFLLGFSLLMLFLGIYVTKAADSGHNWTLIGQALWWVIAVCALVGGLAALGRIKTIAELKKGKARPGDKAVATDASYKSPLTLLFISLLLALWLYFTYNRMAPFDWSEAIRNPAKLINSLCGLATTTPIVLGGLIAALPIVVLVFRVLVYFRDAYRAEHFGVPDLVEFIRHLDAELDDQFKEHRGRRISLSLIGHSMGALVVTGAVRILSDVFDQRSMSNLNTGEGAAPSPNIGQRLQLGNLVLVSPDIPAEALLSGRANFLAASIHRFKESHLFSNEGDVVVRCISSIGNAFSFPSSTRKHGQRLANAHVTWNAGSPKPPFGIVNPIGPASLPMAMAATDFLNLLYVGRYKITELQERMPAQAKQDPLATCLNYFDCTDYRDVPDDAVDQTALVSALTYARKSRFVSIADLILLMVNYLRLGWFMPQWRKDVHSAYFDFPTTRTLIYASAHGGLRHAIGSMSSPSASIDAQIDAFHKKTATLGLQALLSEQSIGTLPSKDERVHIEVL